MLRNRFGIQKNELQRNKLEGRKKEKGKWARFLFLFFRKTNAHTTRRRRIETQTRNRGTREKRKINFKGVSRIAGVSSMQLYRHLPPCYLGVDKVAYTVRRKYSTTIVEFDCEKINTNTNS